MNPTPKPEPVSLDAPPSGLSAAAQSFWRETMGTFELERHHVLVLNEMLFAWDRSQEARAIIDREGPTTRDRFGQTKLHPLIAVERDARTQCLRAARELDLDGTPEDDARPTRLERNS